MGSLGQMHFISDQISPPSLPPSLPTHHHKHHPNITFPAPHIRNFRVNNQHTSPLFTTLPTEVYLLILGEWATFPSYERVLFNLVCKRFANDLPVRRGAIPRVPGSSNFSASAAATTTTASKRVRLNFMMRLAPWFDGCAVRGSVEVQMIEEARKQRLFDDVTAVAVVERAWVLCVACLKYVRATSVMVDLNAVVGGKGEVDIEAEGCWTRCVVQREDGAVVAKGGLLRGGGVVGGEDVQKGLGLGLAELERDWTHFPATPSYVPGYFNPKTHLRKMVKMVDGKAVAGAGAKKAKGKGKEKVDAPQKIGAKKGGIDGGIKAIIDKAPEELTGFEECVWLPVDVHGERTPVFAVCPMHTFDPIHFVGL